MQTLTIKLKQHTPILHFQGEYAGAGATIRVTELKPKLDRYISANYDIKPEWKIGKKNALNYKLRIVDGEGFTASCESLPMYFAEPKKRPMDKSYSKKPILAKTKAMVDDKKKEYSVCLHFFCINKELATLLEGLNYADFFLATTFGTRQSKGYGSFFTTDAIEKDYRLGNIIKTGNEDYRVDSYFALDGTPADWNDVMVHINDIHKCLRSGINEGRLYFKSLMFSYAKYSETNNTPKGLYWDKRMIKESFFLNDRKKQLEGHPGSDPLLDMKPTGIKQQPYLFRDYLGLSTFENWKFPYNTTISKKNDSIDRFKSPILFKPLFDSDNNQWVVFLLHREIPEDYKGKIFNVKEKKRNLHKAMTTYPDFSMKDFLDYVWGLQDYESFFSIKDDNNEARERKDRIVNDLICLRDHYKRIK